MPALHPNLSFGFEFQAHISHAARGSVFVTPISALLIGCKPGVAANQDKFASRSGCTQVRLDSFSIVHRQAPDDFRNAAALAGSSQSKRSLNRRCLRHRLSLRQPDSRNEWPLSIADTSDQGSDKTPVNPKVASASANRSVRHDVMTHDQHVDATRDPNRY